MSAAADDSAPVERGGEVQVAAAESSRLVSFILDGGSTGSLVSAQVLAQLKRDGHVIVLADGVRNVRRSWRFGQGGAVSVCDVIALCHFWGGRDCASDGGFSMRVRFSVVQEDGVPSLIGQNTLEAVGAVVDHQERTVRFGGMAFVPPLVIWF